LVDLTNFIGIKPNQMNEYLNCKQSISFSCLIDVCEFFNIEISEFLIKASIISDQILATIGAKEVICSVP